MLERRCNTTFLPHNARVEVRSFGDNACWIVRGQERGREGLRRSAAPGTDLDNPPPDNTFYETNATVLG